METMEEEDPSERELIPSEEDEVEEATKGRTYRGQRADFRIRRASEKVQLSELLQPVSAVPALRPVQKQLKKAQQKKPTEIPLSKEETERVVREAAYSQTAEALNKWDPVVKQNRRAEQLIFPLQQESVSIVPIEEVMSGWQARTPLEQEIFSLLHKAQQPVKDPLLTPQEKVSLKAMSLEEAKLRRMELQRARALQSYYEAKARREGKIKSKKFHKILRKGKSRKVLQEFETLRKCNPEAALEQLEKIEKARIEERMSLKHQNKGRWAKSTIIMAKQAMQEQLAQNKELTKKVCPASESEEEDIGDNPEAEKDLVPDVVNERHIGMASDNPWMLGKSPAESKEKLNLPAEDSGESEGEEEEPLMANEKDPSQASDGQWQSLKWEQPFLSEKLKRIRTLDDLEEGLEPEDVPQADEMLPPKETPPAQPAGAKSQPQTSKSKKSAKQQALIDLKSVLAGAPCATRCPLVPAAVQDERSEQLKKPANRKSLIWSFPDGASGQVNQLPFPFESSQQFERSIQVPVGSTWNTQRAFQQLTAPRIITQPGQIIRPITAEDTNLIHQKDRSTATVGPKLDLELTLPRPHRIPKKKGW
ncbi:hypothetical protein E2320_013010 [Naja naja]|nr:hypothetical protein E2320_013010 [Naja naja]